MESSLIRYEQHGSTEMAYTEDQSDTCRHIGGGVYLVGQGRERVLILRPFRDLLWEPREFLWEHSDGQIGVNQLVDLMSEDRPTETTASAEPQDPGAGTECGPLETGPAVRAQKP
jgi:hypothetical protein